MTSFRVVINAYIIIPDMNIFASWWSKIWIYQLILRLYLQSDCYFLINQRSHFWLLLEQFFQIWIENTGSCPKRDMLMSKSTGLDYIMRFTHLWDHQPAIFIGLAYMPLPCEIVNDIGISTVICGRASDRFMRVTVHFADLAIAYVFARKWASA